MESRDAEFLTALLLKTLCLLVKWVAGAVERRHARTRTIRRAVVDQRQAEMPDLRRADSVPVVIAVAVEFGAGSLAGGRNRKRVLNELAHGGGGLRCRQGRGRGGCGNFHRTVSDGRQHGRNLLESGKVFRHTARFHTGATKYLTSLIGLRRTGTLAHAPGARRTNPAGNVDVCFVHKTCPTGLPCILDRNRHNGNR